MLHATKAGLDHAYSLHFEIHHSFLKTSVNCNALPSRSFWAFWLYRMLVCCHPWLFLYHWLFYLVKVRDPGAGLALGIFHHSVYCKLILFICGEILLAFGFFKFLNIFQTFLFSDLSFSHAVKLEVVFWNFPLVYHFFCLQHSLI